MAAGLGPPGAAKTRRTLIAIEDFGVVRGSLFVKTVVSCLRRICKASGSARSLRIGSFLEDYAAMGAADGNDSRRKRTVEQLRRAREQMERRLVAEHDRRRAEDQIREELRDSRAITIGSQKPVQRKKPNSSVDDRDKDT